MAGSLNEMLAYCPASLFPHEGIFILVQILFLFLFYEGRNALRRFPLQVLGQCLFALSFLYIKGQGEWPILMVLLMVGLSLNIFQRHIRANKAVGIFLFLLICSYLYFSMEQMPHGERVILLLAIFPLPLVEGSLRIYRRYGEVQSCFYWLRRLGRKRNQVRIGILIFQCCFFLASLWAGVLEFDPGYLLLFQLLILISSYRLLRKISQKRELSRIRAALKRKRPPSSIR